MRFKTAKKYRGGRNRETPQSFPLLEKKKLPHKITGPRLYTTPSIYNREMFAEKMITKPVKVLGFTAPTSTKLGRITLQYDGTIISDQIKLVPHEPWVASWMRDYPAVVIQKEVPSEYFKSISVHEAIEKYLAEKYGLSDKAEGHEAADAIERKEFTKTRSEDEWNDYGRKVERIHRKELADMVSYISPYEAGKCIKIINWAKRQPRMQEGETVMMSPKEFLSKCPSTHSVHVPASQDRPDDFSQNSIKCIENQIKKGEELNLPYLDYTTYYDGWPAHEGRHRAFVAQKMGIKKMPVYVIKQRSGGKFSKRQLDMGTLVELEHTNNKRIARKIAIDHLKEHPRYYTFHAEMEKKMKRSLK